MGPMFAGKTSELLRRVKLHEAIAALHLSALSMRIQSPSPLFRVSSPCLLDLQADGMQVLVVKSAVDNRYADHEIVTHDGIRRARACGPSCPL